MTVAARPACSRPYCLVDVLDHLLAPLVLEIDVDIGRLAALRGDEALEQQVDGIGVDLGDAEAIADHRIGRRAAALAEDRLRQAPRIGDDVMHGQKERGITELADHPQLVIEDLADIGLDAALGSGASRRLP